MFILISIRIFVKLIQEYRGGAYIYSDGKGLNHKRPKMALTTLESFFIYCSTCNNSTFTKSTFFNACNDPFLMTHVMFDTLYSYMYIMMWPCMYKIYP